MPIDTPPTRRTVDVVVIGGGITGCATAYNLALAGATVTLVERSDLNTEASGRNAGSLHGQLQHDAFRRQGEEWARQMLPALGLLVDSIELWRQLGDELGTDLEVSTKGGLLIAETQEQLRQIERKVEIERSYGFPMQVLSQAELREVAPYISDRMVGAGFSPMEGKANPLVAAPAFARAAAALGASICTGAEVLGVERERDGFRVRSTAGEFAGRRVVLAGGASLTDLARPFGTHLPISIEPVQVNATEAVAPLVPHLVYFAGARLTLKQAASGALLIGGGWPARSGPDGNPIVNPESLRANLAVAQRVVPLVGRARLVRSWVGVGTGTPDGLPILGEMPGVPGLFVGLFPHMGLTAGPLLGRLLSQLALGQPVDRDIAQYALDRF